MNKTLKLVAFDSVFRGENVRLPNLLNLNGLSEDIETNGLRTPIMVWPVGDKYMVLQGHRRHQAAEMVKARNIEAFNRVFPKGQIECLVVDGITEAEAMVLKVDHGNEQRLTDPTELLLCAKLLFAAGETEEAVCTELASLMESIKPMKAETRKKLDELREAKAKATDSATQVKLDREIRDLILAYRRGYVQNLHNTVRCPDIVMASIMFKAADIVPEGFDDQYLPGLTQAEITSLYKAHKDDLEILENGIPKYNKRVTGPNFQKKWDAIIEAEEKAETAAENGEARAKAMSAKEMEAEITEGKWNSEGFKRLTKHHLGKKDVGDLTRFDNILYWAELVANNATKDWDTVVAKAKEIEKTITAAKPAEAKPSKPAKK